MDDVLDPPNTYITWQAPCGAHHLSQSKRAWRALAEGIERQRALAYLREACIIRYMRTSILNEGGLYGGWLTRRAPLNYACGLIETHEIRSACWKCMRFNIGFLHVLHGNMTINASNSRTSLNECSAPAHLRSTYCAGNCMRWSRKQITHFGWMRWRVLRGCAMEVLLDIMMGCAGLGESDEVTKA